MDLMGKLVIIVFGVVFLSVALFVSGGFKGDILNNLLRIFGLIKIAGA